MEKDFSTITEILTDIVANDKNFARNCRMSIMFTFWGEIVGEKFKNISKVYDYKNKKLYVTCQNAFICQELSFNKAIVLKKLRNFIKGLDIEVEDAIFNYKNWESFAPCADGNESIENVREYSQEELDRVEIDETQLVKIRENLEAMGFLDEAQKQKYYKNVLNTLRAQKLRE